MAGTRKEKKKKTETKNKRRLKRDRKTYEIEHYITTIEVGPHQDPSPLQLDQNFRLYYKSGDVRKYEGVPRTVY